MLKRPLSVICMIVILFLSVLQAIQRSEEDRLILQTEQILMKYAEENKHVAVHGTVNTCSRLSSGIRLYLDHITVSPTDASEFSLLPDTQIIFTTEDETILPGDQLLVYGEMVFWEKVSNPGAFDSRKYYFSDNIVCSLDKPKIKTYIPGEAGIKHMLYMLRRMMESSFYEVLDEKTAGTIAAVCLGEKGGMDSEWKETFQEGGIAHILAISGLHITLIGTGIYQILRKTGCSIFAAALCVGTFIILYTVMTGFSVSAVRAVIMFCIWLGAQVFGRKYDMLTAVSGAAIALLIKDSRVLIDASFLLSFSAVLVLAILIPAVNDTCMLRNAVMKNVVSGILVWIGTLPVTLFFFYQTAPWSFLLNLIVVPLMSLIMISGLSAAMAGCVYLPWGIFLGAPVYYLLYFFEWLCQMEKKLVQAVWITGKPQNWRICLFYVMLGGCVLISRVLVKGNTHGKKEQCYKVRALWLTVLGICIGLMNPGTPDELRITCLDVGQGDGAVLQMPTGEVFLVDGGSTSEGQVWKYQMEKTLKYYGISEIEGIFLSHDDQDHISGVEEYLDEYQKTYGGKNKEGISLRQIYLPTTDRKETFLNLKEKAVKAGIEVVSVSQGSRIESEKGGWSIQCLSPNSHTLSGDSNEDSMVLMVTYGTFRMLFTGDFEGNAEKRLAQNGMELDAEVLKVGHHGSANGSSEEFLQMVAPEISVISCGKNNRYGHPAEETLERLKKAGSKIFVTAEDGAVQIVSDGKGYSVKE